MPSFSIVCTKLGLCKAGGRLGFVFDRVDLRAGDFVADFQAR